MANDSEHARKQRRLEDGSGIEVAAELVTPTHPDFHINPPPHDRPIRIYCDGIYDLFHFGHARALEQAKKVFPNVYLMVGVCNDKLTHSMKGRTVLTDTERYESLRHCRWVDEVVPDAPWTIDEAFLDKHRIDYVAHDDLPYVSAGQDDVYAEVKRRGQFLPTRRTEGVSTSDLITRIVRDYDAYLRRNLQRGMTAKELNISFLKEKELTVKQSVDEMKESLRRNWMGTREELLSELDLLKNGVKQTMRVWDERSTEFVRGFIARFGNESVMQKLLRLRPTPNQSPTGSDSDIKTPDDTSSDGQDGAATAEEEDNDSGSNAMQRSASAPTPSRPSQNGSASRKRTITSAELDVPA